MNKKFIQKMKNTLLEQKVEILKQESKEINIDTEGDEIDAIQGKLLIELSTQLHNRNSNKLIQIESAIKRIDDNSYGLCEDCNESIPEKRLLLNPYFQTCVSCAEEREIEEKQRKRF